MSCANPLHRAEKQKESDYPEAPEEASDLESDSEQMTADVKENATDEQQESSSDEEDAHIH